MKKIRRDYTIWLHNRSHIVNNDQSGSLGKILEKIPAKKPNTI